jgi:hypothetical protein
VKKSDLEPERKPGRNTAAAMATTVRNQPVVGDAKKATFIREDRAANAVWVVV